MNKIFLLAFLFVIVWFIQDYISLKKEVLTLQKEMKFEHSSLETMQWDIKEAKLLTESNKISQDILELKLKNTSSH